MKNLKIKNATKIIWIENKANYIDYIKNKKADDEFIIYHGGMYSPIRGEFFKKIYNATNNMKFYHWSDIDLGGFKIFNRLQKIIPELQPYKMDKCAFYSGEKYWKKMDTKYMEKLENLKNDQNYEMFFDVIDAMLKTKCKLEQEAFII